MPSATGLGSARICQLILPTWRPECSRLRAPTTPPAALAGRQRAPSRPRPSPVRAPSPDRQAQPPPPPGPRCQPGRGSGAGAIGKGGSERSGAVSAGLPGAQSGGSGRTAAGLLSAGHSRETGGWCGALRGQQAAAPTPGLAAGPPLPEGGAPHPTRCLLGGEAPAVPAAPAPPRPALPPLRRRPDPGPAPPHPPPLPPRPALPARRQQRPPPALPQPRCGPMGGRAGRVSSRRGARGCGEPSTDGPQREQRPPRAAGQLLSAPSRSGPVPQRGPRRAGERGAGAQGQAGGGGGGGCGAARTRAGACEDRRRLSAPRQSSRSSARSRRLRGTPPRARPPRVTSARPAHATGVGSDQSESRTRGGRPIAGRAEGGGAW